MNSISIILELGPTGGVDSFTILNTYLKNEIKTKLVKVPYNKSRTSVAAINCQSCHQSQEVDVYIQSCLSDVVFIQPTTEVLVKCEPDKYETEFIYDDEIDEPPTVELDDFNEQDEQEKPSSPEPQPHNTSLPVRDNSFEDIDDDTVRCKKCNTTIERSQMKSHCSKCPSQLMCLMCKRTDFKGLGNLRAHERYCNGKPRGDPVCEICGRRFASHGVVRQHIQSVHKNAKPFQCNICPGVAFANKKTLVKHINEHEQGLLTLSCNHCPAMFSSKLQMKKHISSEHESDFQCTECDPPIGFPTQKTLQQHISKSHVFSSAAQTQPDKIKCQYCSSMLTENGMRSHRKYCTGELICKLCDRKDFISIFSLRAHERYCRGNEPVPDPICTACNIQFETLVQLKRHQDRKHNEGNFRCCDLCGTKVHYKSFEKHCLSHTDNPKPYQCNECNRRFSVKALMRKHILIKHCESFPGMAFCYDCNPPKKFISECEVESHKKSYHTNRAYPCSECGKVFKCDKLKTHMLAFHTPAELKRDKEYQCEYPGCNFRSLVKASFQSHQYMHVPDSEKPFRCSTCGKGFSDSFKCERHEMIHKGVKPFSCEVCGKAFLYKATLKTHSRLHTGEKPYECSICNQRFGDRGCYRSHVLGHEKQLNIKLSTSVKKFDKRYTVPVPDISTLP